MLTSSTFQGATNSRACSKNFVSFMPQRFCHNCAKNHTLLFCVWLLGREERAHSGRTQKTVTSSSAALLRVDMGDRYFVRRMNFTRKLRKNHILVSPFRIPWAGRH